MAKAPDLLPTTALADLPVPPTDLGIGARNQSERASSSPRSDVQTAICARDLTPSLSRIFST